MTISNFDPTEENEFQYEGLEKEMNELLHANDTVKNLHSFCTIESTNHRCGRLSQGNALFLLNRSNRALKVTLKISWEEENQHKEGHIIKDIAARGYVHLGCSISNNLPLKLFNYEIIREVRK